MCLREGWVKVPIPAGLMVRDARLDGQPVPLIEGPPAHVVLSRAGRAVLSLEISLPLASSAGTESITLPSSPAPMSRATLALPRGGVDLTVTGGFVSERSETPTESRWTALGRANQPLDVFVETQGRRSPRRTVAALPRARRVGRSASAKRCRRSPRSSASKCSRAWRARSRSRCRRASSSTRSTARPWPIGKSMAGLLRVRLLDPVDHRTVVRRAGREPACPPTATCAVPLVRVPAAERETGGVAISVLGAGEIEKHQMRGLEPADVSDLADVVAGRESPSMVAFRLRPVGGNDPRSLNVSVKRYTPQAVLIANVEEARYRVLAAEDGLLLVEAHYAVRNNQRSFLKVTLPPRATIWSASVAGKPVRPGVAEGRCGAAARSKRAAPAKMRRRSSCGSRTCNRSAAWSRQGARPTRYCRRSICRSRAPASSCITRRGFASSLEPGAFRVESDPGRVRRGVARRAPRLALRAGVGGGTRWTLAPPPAAPQPPAAGLAPPASVARVRPARKTRLHSSRR